jgi:hypothetical protein
VAETLIEEDYDNDNFEAYQASIRLAARQFVHTGLHSQENKNKGALGSQFPRNQQELAMQMRLAEILD